MATAPNHPSAVTLTLITSNSVFATFTDGGNNGATINSRQIGYGTNPVSTQHIVSSDRSTAITGLTPGTKYYFWARTHNSEGWSPWSARRDATTLSIVHINVGGVWKTAIPYKNVGGVWKIALPWSRSAGVWTEAK